MNKMRVISSTLVSKTRVLVPVRVDYDSDLDNDPSSWDTDTTLIPGAKLYMPRRWENPLVDSASSNSIELVLQVGYERILRIFLAKVQVSGYATCGTLVEYAATETLFRQVISEGTYP